MSKLRFIHITLLVMAAMTVFSCGGAKKSQQEDIGTANDWEEIQGGPVRGHLQGDWPPIQLSMDKISFGPEGGSITVTCENYSKWWLNDVQIYGTEKYIHADPGANNEYLTLNAEGFKAVILEGSKVKITVSPSKAPGDWLLHLEAGDAFTQIRITKEGL